MDPPLVLTQLHDPKLIFRAQFPFQLVDPPLSPTPQSLPYDDLWDNFQRMSRAYNDLLTQNKDLSDAHHALQDEFTNLRDLYWRLRCKNQELVDEAIHTRIESWRHAVRLEELKKELRLLQQHTSTHPPSSKRKFPDIEHDADNDPGDASDADAWSASTRSQSLSNTDTFNTPTSGASSKIPPPPLPPSLPLITKLKDSSDIVHSLHHHPRATVITASRGEPCIREEPSAEIRTPKRPRRSYSRPACDDNDDADAVINTDASAHRPQDSPIGKEHQAGTKRATRQRRTPPQTRSRTRSSRCRRVSVEQQNATAAAVAAALSGAAASNSHSGNSVSPSPPERRSL